jgi:predicted PurR-regulated permease PerM
MSSEPVTAPSTKRPDEYVPLGVQIGAAWAWRLLLLAALVYVLFKVTTTISVVLIPVSVALLLCALLLPAVRLLERRGLPRGLATAVVTVTGIAVVGGVLTFVIQQAIHGLPDLQSNVTDSFNRVRDWLVNGPPNLKPQQIDNAIKAATDALTKNRESLTSGALTTASAVGEFVTGGLLTLFSLVFLLYDGPRIWKFLLRFVPADVRDRVDVAGHRGFASLVGYVRATVLVAFTDAVGIGIGLAIMGVPLALPLAAVVFLGSFIPIVGALLSGSIAVAVTLVTLGPIQALVVLGIVLAVQQIEGHVLQPLLMGRAVELHGLAVVLAIATGVVLGGIVGALMAVPIVAVGNSMIRSLHSDRPGQSPTAIDAADPNDATPPGEGPGEHPDAAAELDPR